MEGGRGSEGDKKKRGGGIAEEKRTGFPDIGGLFLSSFMGTERKRGAVILPGSDCLSDPARGAFPGRRLIYIGPDHF